MPSSIRVRWAAIGAAVAVTLGAGGLVTTHAEDRVGTVPSALVAVPPTRVLDTRIAVGVPGPLSDGDTETLHVIGRIETSDATGAEVSRTVVPEGATAVVVNVTAVRPSGVGYVSVRPAGEPESAATGRVNIREPGSLVSAHVTVQLPNAGTNAGDLAIRFRGADRDASTHIVLDVVGYYVAAGTGAQGPEGERGPAGPAGQAAPRAADELIVARSGGDFTSVGEAVASITDASAERPYLVSVGPGRYTESGGVALPPHVDVVGSGTGTTTLTFTSDDSASALLIIGRGTDNELRDLSITVSTDDAPAMAIGARADAGGQLRLDHVDLTVDATGGSASALVAGAAGVTMAASSIDLRGAGDVEDLRGIVASGAVTLTDTSITAAGAPVVQAVAGGDVSVAGSRIELSGATDAAIGITADGAVEVRDSSVAIDGAGATAAAISSYGDDTVVIDSTTARVAASTRTSDDHVYGVYAVGGSVDARDLRVLLDDDGPGAATAAYFGVDGREAVSITDAEVGVDGATGPTTAVRVTARAWRASGLEVDATGDEAVTGVWADGGGEGRLEHSHVDAGGSRFARAVLLSGRVQTLTLAAVVVVSAGTSLDATATGHTAAVSASTLVGPIGERLEADCRGVVDGSGVQLDATCAVTDE